MKKIFLKSAFLLGGLAILMTACSQTSDQTVGNSKLSDMGEFKGEKVSKSAKEWRASLTASEYRILREKGTEAPGTGKYEHTETKGTYVCAGCQNPLFDSETKYHSGSGWPAFYDGIDGNIAVHLDRSGGWERTEILCAKCDGHLGHVFEDGPKPTGLRYCVNSASLDLQKKE